MENNGEAKWYVVHTYTGHEKMVEDNLKKMIENSNLQDFIQEIAIPVEEDIVEKNGKKKVSAIKNNFYFFPGCHSIAPASGIPSSRRLFPLRSRG